MVELLARADLDQLGQPGPDGVCPKLNELLTGIEAHLRLLSDTISYYYFSHAELRIS